MLIRLLTFAIVILAVQPAAAIVVRDDRDDAAYLKLGARHPAAARILPDGSGVLVAPDWVLTAAHVARGVASRSPKVEIDGREFAVVRAVVHEDWQDRGPHDIALLQLAEPVKGVDPVALYPGEDEVGKIITFVGNGDTGTGLTGPQTMDGKKRGATNTVESADDDWIFFTFNQGEEATELEGVSGPGDSGGPALLELDGTVYTLGVSVFSDGGGSAEIPDTPFGAIVREYVETYNRNDDAAMRSFIGDHFQEAFRASKSEQEHLDLYRRLFDEHFGKITLRAVVRDSASGLSLLVDSAKGRSAEFRFDAGEGNDIAGMQVAIVEVSRD